MVRTMCFLVGYRFHDFMHPLRIPYVHSLTAKEIREKARASAAVAGIFLAFLVALLGALVAAEGKDVIEKIKPASLGLVITGILGALLPYFTLRAERKISAAPWEAQAWRERTGRTDAEQRQKERLLRAMHNVLLLVWLVVYLLFFFVPPFPSMRASGLALSGLFLVIGSLVFLVFSVELYDTAGGWQRLNDTAYHFHVASLASHCYLLGLSTTLVGFSLLLCLTHLRTGYGLSVLSTFLLIILTKIERRLFHLA
jgi:hypothetical protein